ncbi:restriction endonuclease [Alcaligenaceae bacterium SJ-26]|nr:restriction endonuclease [Alcaligenaceae bacterium SJ-26]
MKLKMAKNSLFAILLRNPWWISACVALAFVGVAFAVLPPEYAPVGAIGAFPFVVIAAIAGWKQMRAPRPAQLEAVRGEVAAMNWKAFAARLEQSWQAAGYQVEVSSQEGADWLLRIENRRIAVSARRWKSAHTGLEPLTRLLQAGEQLEANERWYIALGQPSESAAAYAARQNIRLIDEIGLTRIFSANII